MVTPYFELLNFVELLLKIKVFQNHLKTTWIHDYNYKNLAHACIFFFFFLHFKSFSFDSHDLNGLGRKLWVVNVTVSLHNTSNSSKYQEESCSPWYANNTRPEGIYFFYSQSFALLGEGFDCDGLYLHNCVCKRGFIGPHAALAQ